MIYNGTIEKLSPWYKTGVKKQKKGVYVVMNIDRGCYPHPNNPPPQKKKTKNRKIKTASKNDHNMQVITIFMLGTIKC